MIVDPNFITQMYGKFDFLVADGGKEDKFSTKYAEWEDLAAKLDIPIIMKYGITGDGSYTYDMGKPETGFPDPKVDMQLLGIRHAIAGRVTHAIMLAYEDLTMTDGKVTLTEGNLANLLKWFYENTWGQYKKPVYTYLSNDILNNTYPKGMAALTQVTNLDSVGMCSWKSAFPGAITKAVTWDQFPICPDGYVPQSILNASPIHFANYSHTAFTFPGIKNTSGVPIPVGLWKYKGDKAMLYADLNFVPKAVYIPPAVVVPPVVTVTPPVTSMLSLSVNELATLRSAVETILKIINIGV